MVGSIPVITKVSPANLSDASYSPAPSYSDLLLKAC